MDGKIKYRDFRSSDFPYMKRMFCKAFGLEEYSDDEEVMNHLLANYLYSYLERESYIIIAEDNSIPVGFLIGNYRENIKEYTKLKYMIMEKYHKFFLRKLESGKKYIRCKGLIEEANRKLIENRKERFDSELILFVVDESMRGHGVGTGMLEKFKKYLIDSGGKNLYLYTDDFCDVNYYRRMKFRQEDSRIVNLGQGEEESRFYLFSIPVRKIS